MKLVDRFQYVLTISVASYLITNIYVLSTMAFYALPALLAMATVRRLWRRQALFVVTLSLAVVMLDSLARSRSRSRPGNTWTLAGVGGSRGRSTATALIRRGRRSRWCCAVRACSRSDSR